MLKEKLISILDASATVLAQAIRDRQLSSTEIVDTYLRRIDQVNPKLNAVVQRQDEAARTRARIADAALARGENWGPLHGVPFTVKDAFDTAGIISTGGTQGRAGYIPTQDAVAVARLRAAGAILLGKTNVPELSLAFESDNLIYGRTNNPYDLTRTSGGSSGGEAALIAAGGSPLGIGTDSAGSLRVPSHFCGIATLKSTAGRVPRTGIFPPSVGVIGRFWHVGALARRVQDLVTTLPLLAGPDGHDPLATPGPLLDPADVALDKLRIAYYTDNGIIPATAETVQVVKQAAQVFADHGATVEEARPAGIEQSFDLATRLFAADGGAGAQMLLQMAGTTQVSPLLQRIGQILQPFAPANIAELAGLLVQWDLFQGQMLAFMDRYDAILCPVNAFPAMAHGTTFDEDRVPAFSYTMTYNLTGWPAVVVRGGTSPEGLPIGVQVVARPWREDIALAIGQQFEDELGGWQKPSL